MASVVHHFSRQLSETGKVRLFGGSHGYPDGEHRRDFVFVEDIVGVNLWAANGAGVSGIYNVGTGASRSFNDIAKCIALGATLGGMAGQFLKAAAVSTEKAVEMMKLTKRQIEVTMFACGTKEIRELEYGKLVKQ
jgi:nucleoside-diphosphate-sugar epimerase